MRKVLAAIALLGFLMPVAFAGDDAVKAKPRNAPLGDFFSNDSRNAADLSDPELMGAYAIAQVWNIVNDAGAHGAFRSQRESDEYARYQLDQYRDGAAELARGERVITPDDRDFMEDVVEDARDTRHDDLLDSIGLPDTPGHEHRYQSGLHKRHIAFNEAQIGFIFSFAASVVAAKHCEGFALDKIRAAADASILGLTAEDWDSEEFKEEVKNSTNKIKTFESTMCPAFWRLFGPESATKMLGRR
jgi:hypothetical protein